MNRTGMAFIGRIIMKQITISLIVMGLKKITNVLLLISFITAFLACTDEKTSENVPISSGTYLRSVCVQSDTGSEPTTKAMDNEVFTAEYDAEFIYIHSYDTDESEDRWVRYPVNGEEIENCSKGFHLNIEVTESGEYEITGQNESGEPKTITFQSGEQVYFSSTQSELWEGKTSTNSPLSQQTVLIRDEDEGGANSAELYRSQNYSIESLVTGASGVSNGILMERKCSAFLVFFLFTDPDNRYQIWEESDWERLTGTKVSDWYGKIYLGPCFSNEYDIEKEDASNNTTSGYYASWGQTYHVFEDLVYQGGSGAGQGAQYFEGFGVNTVETYLITPYDVNYEGNMTFYAFLKYQDSDADDEGAKWFTYEFDAPVPEFNTTNIYAVICDIDDLAAFTSPSSDTRSITGPQKIDLQPIEVIHIQE